MLHSQKPAHLSLFLIITHPRNDERISPHGSDIITDPLEWIKETLTDPVLTCDVSDIHIGFIDNVPACYVHAQVNQKTGWSRITYMGIVPEFRGKGFGAAVHCHCFKMIRALGGTLYHGGTSSENHAMLRLFVQHKCVKYAKMQKWVLNIQLLRTT